MNCTCWKCLSVLYCSPQCRNRDQAEHKWSCFLHPAWECKEAQQQRAIIAKAKGQENNTLAEDVPELVGLEQGIQTNGRAPTGMEAATENLQQVNDDAGQGQEELPDKEAANVDQGADDGAMDVDADQDAQGGASAEGE